MNEYKIKYLNTEGEESGGCGLVQGGGLMNRQYFIIIC